ncbi:MAG: hypothetical protein WCL13_01780 [bacterium]
MTKKLLVIGVLLLVVGFVVIANNSSASTTEGNLVTGLQTGLEGVTKAAPTLSPAASDYHATQTVTLTASGATKICYTTDGTTEPSCASATTCTAGTALASGGTISVSAATTVKSAGCYADASTGPVATSAYTFSCTTASVSNGSVGAYSGCAITCNSGYTLSGSTCVSSGGGGGGVTTPTYCSSVTYSDWSATCTSGLQYRDLLTQTPNGCTLTAAQTADRQKTCSTVTYCSAVTYSGWGACANNLQYRDLLTQTPNGCTLTSAQTADRQKTCSTAPTTPPAGNLLNDIASEAEILATEDTNQLLNHLGNGANNALEQASLIKYKLILGLDKNISAEEKMTINDFIVYGTRSTQRLGAGERAAVINSYYQAYGRLPNSEAEWSDVIKIANGRWPSERSAKAEAQAKLEFIKVYRRNAVMTNNIDENAIMIISYGLLPLQRNLNSERIAIKTFESVYRHPPINALAWNIVRAIAYSGAKR